MQRRQRAAYTVRRFELRPLFRFGLLIGGFVGFFPSLFGALAIMGAVSGLRQVMENARQVKKAVPLINQSVTFDFVDLLGLTGFLERLAFVDDHAWLFGSALFVFLVVLFAIGFSLAAMAGAMLYNGLNRSIGGLRVELEDTTPER